MISEEQMALDWDVAQHIAAGTSDEPLVPVVTCEHWIARPIYYENGLWDALPQIWVRKGVRDRLIQASNFLPPKYRLVLLDGWRSKIIQQFLFEKVRMATASKNPTLSDSEIDRKTLLYAARPSDDPVRPSPHITGGAIDVTLADENGTILDMGSEFDESSEMSWTAAAVPTTVADRRQHLLTAMQQAGFTNLPSEWWHFDYGNWLWAWYSKQPAALYGPILRPSD
jgi:D-alanyl-D-alanine dipeptidase